LGLLALYRPASTGAAGMMGQVGVVKRALDPEGQVLIDGELWQAVAEDGPVAAGEMVRVVDGALRELGIPADRIHSEHFGMV